MDNKYLDNFVLNEALEDYFNELELRQEVEEEYNYIINEANAGKKIGDKFSKLMDINSEIAKSKKKKEIEKFKNKMLAIINKKKYKYYCIYDFYNPVKGALFFATAGSKYVSVSSANSVKNLYKSYAHYTLFGSNKRPFTKSMLADPIRQASGKCWKKEMKAKVLKSTITSYLVKDYLIPSCLKKYLL